MCCKKLKQEKRVSMDDALGMIQTWFNAEAVLARSNFRSLPMHSMTIRTENERRVVIIHDQNPSNSDVETQLTRNDTPSVWLLKATIDGVHSSSSSMAARATALACSR
jgi:hypothetical protein